MICKNCGKENNSDAMFCSACGTPLSEATLPQPEPPFQTVQPPVQQPPYQYQTYQQPQYNQTYQQPQNTMSYSSNPYAKRVSSKLGIRVFVAILSVLISLMMFCPALTLKVSAWGATYTESRSLIEILDNISRSANMSSYYRNSATEEVITTLSVIVAATALSSLFVLIFSLAKRSKGCQDTAMFFSLVHCVAAVWLVVYLSDQIDKLTFGLNQDNIEIGWGVILMIVLSILELILASVAIAGAPSAKNSYPPAPYNSNFPQQPTQAPMPPQNYQNTQSYQNQSNPNNYTPYQ